MAFANSSDSSLAIASQAAFGTANTTATDFQYMRYTGESLAFNVENIVSDEIDSTRNITENYRAAISAGGGIDFELSRDDTFDLLIQAALQSTNTFDAGSHNIFNGVTQRLLTIEKKIVGTAANYFLFDSLMVGSLEIEIEAGGIATGSVELLGRTQAAVTTPSSGLTGTVVAVGTSGVVEAANTSNYLKLEDTDDTEGGGSAQANIQSVSLSIDNTLREQRIIATEELGGIGSGRFNVTGSITAYFETAAEYNKFIGNTARDFELNLTNGTVGYKFFLPKIRYTSAEIVAGGNDDNVMAEFEFQALKATVGSDDYTLEVTRDES